MLLFVMMRRSIRRSAKRCRARLFDGVIFGVFLLAGATATASGQEAAGAAPNASVQAGPIPITLDEAIRRAESNEPAYVSSLAESRGSTLGRSIARAGLLPSIGYHNQALYTQANGLENQAGQGVGAQPSPRFIANNAVREYASQGVANETLGLGGWAAVRRADAEAAHSAAELEIARRGLVSAVTSLFYGVIAADEKVRVAEQARAEAAGFTDLTGKREQGRESAHADVVKAQLVEQQRDREAADARLAAEKARLELAVLLFPDPRTSFSLQGSNGAPRIPTRDEVEQAAAKNNPEIKSALAAMGVSNADVQAARAAYLPDLGLNVTYGIDAPQFAFSGPDHVHNLGYSASVTLDLPVWDWLATEHKVKQSEIRRDASRVALTATQSRLIARLAEAYAEAAAALEQLASLEASVATAAESLRLTKLRYTGGEATVLEVVDAESAYVGAEIAMADGRVRFEAARADLESLTGTM